VYRPAISVAAQRVELFLSHRLAASFHADADADADADGSHFVPINASLIHSRAGLPAPRYF